MASVMEIFSRMETMASCKQSCIVMMLDVVFASVVTGRTAGCCSMVASIVSFAVAAAAAAAGGGGGG